MTIQTSVRKARFLGNSVATAFSFSFKVFAATDLVFVRTTALGLDISLTLNSQVSVTLNADQEATPGGTITYPVSGPPLATGEVLTAYTALAPTQLTDLTNAGGFFPKTITDRMDYLTILIQQILEVQGRTLTGSPSDPSPNFTLATAQQRALTYPTFDSNGNLSLAQSLPSGTLSLASVSALTGPQTTSEATALVVPLNKQWPELDLRRYGGDPSASVAVNTAAINAAIAVAVVAQKPVVVPPGRFLHGRLSTITGAVSFFGIDPLRCILSLSQANWPYAGATSTPVFSSAFDFIASGVGFDQAWTDSFAGHPGTYNDGASPSTWGGYFLGSLTGTGTVRFFNCAFSNIYRGFQITNAQRVIFESNQGYTFNCYGQPIIACESVGSVAAKGNHLECSKWTSNSGALYGLTATYIYNCSDVNINANEFIGYQIHGSCSAVGSNATAMIIGNVIDTPIADTSFFNFYSVAICNNVITNSGDMGISTDNSRYLTVIGNQIRGAHIGGISIGGAFSATVVGNSIVDYAQDYSIINTVAGRYASTGGVWLAGISIGFQGGNGGGAEIIMSGNTLGMNNLPPVSDSGGAVRTNVFGIIFQETPTFSAAISGCVTGNYVHKDFANLPQMFVRVPSHRFNYSATSGTPVSGELFTNGANSFVFLTTVGGGLVMAKKLTGTIPATTVFTGALSGATITSHASPGIGWHNVVDTGNFDWTTVYNPY